MRRNWIKLYVDQCLRGSMMEELANEERWSWIGLLLLAGDCPIEGEIGITNEIGYTDEQISKMIDVPIEILRRAKAKMIEAGKISTGDNNIIRIVNWKKYQSEYGRQRVYRKSYISKLQHKVTSSSDKKVSLLPSLSSSSSVLNKDIEEIKRGWNEFAAENNLAAIIKIDPKAERGRHLAARMAEKDWDFPKLLETVSQSPFLLGKKGKEPFFVTFDWLLWPGNYQRTMEGNYKDRKSNSWDGFLKEEKK
jgi:hypothetical protein